MPKTGKLSYIKLDSTQYEPLKHVDSTKRAWDRISFLWGDPVYVIASERSKVKVSAKGHHILIPKEDLMDTPILHVSLIDCGQGDAALIQFPDMRWMLVDGGPPRKQGWTNTGKIAFDFMKWKIYRDFSWRKEFNFDPIQQKRLKSPPPFHIDSIVITHPDIDHYGGLHELPAKLKESDPFEKITVGTIYHCGLGRFSGPYSKFEKRQGMSQLGPIEGSTLPNAYVTTLIDSFTDVCKYSKTTANRNYKLHCNYAKWLKEFAELEGKGVASLKRLHYRENNGYVPGFDDKDLTIRILGPVEESWNNKPALRYLDNASKSSMGSPLKTRNGLSVVLRLDYKHVRVLLTGDLNFRSQAVLMKYIPLREFRSHIVKACHHGSEDISWKFLQATDPVAVMLSSGDNELHTHPRAKVLGWSGAFATPVQSGRDKTYLSLKEENYRSPLIYSTELSRSVQLWEPYKIFDKQANGMLEEVAKPQIQPRGRNLSKPDTEDPRPMKGWLLADRLIYGMINVRTDGEKIVMGVMKEKGQGFQTESFQVDKGR